MKSLKYNKWDGTQEPFSLKKKEIVDKFMENIMKGMSPNMSMAQMLWEGFSVAGLDFRVMGLEDMLKEFQKQKNDLFSTYNLEHAFDKPMDDFNRLLTREAMTRSEKGDKSSPLYDELPPGLLEKIRRLDDFPFADPESRDLFEHWKNRRRDILELYQFYSEYADKFVGDTDVDFDQAVELMNLFKSIEKMQTQILTGEISSIDTEALRKILGEQAEQSFNILLELPNTITDEGMVSFDKKGFGMTPRGMRALGELAFGKLYQQVKKDRQGGHQGNAPQSGEILPDSSRPYHFGDTFDLDIAATIKRSISRSSSESGSLRLDPEDFYVREREQLITSTTIVLLDLSWSMARNGRFEAGKKVALALDHYVRTRFPKDKLHVVGFSTEARELKGRDLAMAQWDSARPFTNLQGGLRLAMSLIKKSGNRNNRVVVITDGQPTAYYHEEELHVELPNNILGVSPNACRATLAEVKKVTAQGMNIETFMLDDNPVLVEFTRTITRINKGRAVMCLPGELGELVLIQEINRRGGKI
ncbi:VWA domain-containing protein [Thermodesulfobacteriota bacterium]